MKVIYVPNNKLAKFIKRINILKNRLSLPVLCDLHYEGSPKVILQTNIPANGCYYLSGGS